VNSIGESYWIEGPWSGRVAILPRPRGGDWLDDEIRRWKSAGIDVVVSTLTNEEIGELDLGREAELCRANGIDYVVFPEFRRRLRVLSNCCANWKASC
jgi:hypothetical protein